MTELRLAGSADLEGLVASSAALFAEDAGSHDTTMNLAWPGQGGRDVLAAGIDDPTRLTLVAVCDGAVVGHLLGRVEQPGWRSVRVATILSLFVSADHRNAGLGSGLLTRFRSWAAEVNAVALEVTAYTANEAAIRFYARHGFCRHTSTLQQPVDKPHPTGGQQSP